MQGEDVGFAVLGQINKRRNGVLEMEISCGWWEKEKGGCESGEVGKGERKRNTFTAVLARSL